MKVLFVDLKNQYLSIKEEVDEEDIAEIVSKWTGNLRDSHSRIKSVKSCIAGSPPVTTTYGAPAHFAISANSSAGILFTPFGIQDGCQVPAESHQGQ